MAKMGKGKSKKAKSKENANDGKFSSAINAKDLTEEIELFKDQYGDGYAAIFDNGIKTIVPIRGKAFANHLRLRAFLDDKKIISKSKLESFVLQYEAFAIFGNQQHSLEIRTARQGSEFLYDLGTDVVRIASKAWKIESNDRLLFKRYPGMQRQVEPLAGSSLLRILEFINIKDEDDQLLLIVFIVTAFIPDIPHPILAIHGPQGSAKSSLQRFLIQLLDPWATDDVPILNLKEFLQIVSHRWVIPLDNLGELPPLYSDLLCKLVTGAGFTKRQLFTDDDDITRAFRRVIILTGINLPINKPDILDRCIILPLDRIQDNQRKDEAFLNKEFSNLRAGLLGDCFTLLSKAMEYYPEIQLDEKPRLADFAMWGAAVAKALGRDVNDFVRAFKKNIDRQNEEALDSSPLAAVIIHYLRINNRLHGTPTDILKETQNHH